MDAGKFMIDWFIPIWLMITLLEVNIENKIEVTSERLLPKQQLH